ncbi:hypothetical protein [Streptomyces sp. CC219B]|uniref:hypothetical protein n=1 Tax=Streptomyces sp. CC219B TaxID=3044574 RepID=UPI0024A80918|nr:hypothetical protein [Streptomyces sp. CC219B]
MDRSEDRILAEELAALGALTGGSGRLVGMVAKLMSKNVREIDLLVPLPFEEAVERVAHVLGEAGQAVDCVPVGPATEERTIRVVASGGVGGLNPVVVTARVLRAEENSTEVWLRAAAKEGLIRQRAGDKTAVRVAEMLSRATGAAEAGGVR